MASGTASVEREKTLCIKEKPQQGGESRTCLRDTRREWWSMKKKKGRCRFRKEVKPTLLER